MKTFYALWQESWLSPSFSSTAAQDKSVAVQKFKAELHGADILGVEEITQESIDAISATLAELEEQQKALQHHINNLEQLRRVLWLDSEK